MPNGIELSRPARYSADISRFSIKNLLFQIAPSAGSAAANGYAAFIYLAVNYIFNITYLFNSDPTLCVLRINIEIKDTNIPVMSAVTG